MTQPTDVTTTPLPKLAPRAPDSHKGDYGRALLVGGSRGMSGSISLSGLATLRSGAGLVTLAVPRTIQDVVAAFNPSYMTHALADGGDCVTANASNDALLLANDMTALALGPGLGRAGEVTNFVERLYREISLPMVVDADALFALAERPDALTHPGGPRVLTPHPGEFARLAKSLGTGRAAEVAAALKAKGITVTAGAARDPNDNAFRVGTALGFANACRQANNGTVVIVLKGHRTVVTDGKQYTLNQTGNPGMATGGSGDVLTGVITALLCQGLPPFDAARLGVHLHGLAGDLAAEKLGQVSLIASDLIDFLPAAFQTLTAK